MIKPIWKFNAKTIFKETMGAHMAKIAMGSEIIGKKTQEYMKNYIDKNRHRRGGTGKLAKSITYEPIRTGKGFLVSKIGFKIGRISQLEKYWKFVAYGGVIPASTKKFIRGSFEGQAPDPSMKNGKAEWISGKGGFKMKPNTPVRPIPYISSTVTYVKKYIRNITRIK